MAPVNREEISLYDEAKAGLSSLISQTAQVFIGLLVMLLLTGGNPPGWVVALSFFVGTGFVAWSENKRLTGFKEANLYGPKTFVDSEQHTVNSEDSSVGELPQQVVRLTNAEALLPQDISPNKRAVLKRSIALFSPDPQKLQALIQRVVEAKTDDFLALARVVDLKPGKDFAGANLTSTSLMHTNLIGADLSSADLRGASLWSAALRGANLSSANLSSANLRGANLSGANLSGADLSSADLRRASLSDANLSSADLSGADLRRANLWDANLNDANVEKAWFGENLGLSEDMKLNLKQKGAIFEDSLGDPSEVLTRRKQ